jgi:hypothetical protein
VEQLAFLTGFADRHGLRYESGISSDGLRECYVFSPDMHYRYAFARWWDARGPLVLWVGVNPAKGDTENRRRPTLDRCIRWSRSWEAGGLMFANLFAARYNKPRDLRGVPDPVGPYNDAALKALSQAASRTVAAWGSWGRLKGRAAQVASLLTSPVCLGVTASGQPRHPLYVRGGTQPMPWSDRSLLFPGPRAPNSGNAIN